MGIKNALKVLQSGAKASGPVSGTRATKGFELGMESAAAGNRRNMPATEHTRNQAGTVPVAIRKRCGY